MLNGPEAAPSMSVYKIYQQFTIGTEGEAPLPKAEGQTTKIKESQSQTAAKLGCTHFELALLSPALHHSAQGKTFLPLLVQFLKVVIVCI